jgi:hypothetical protein
VAEDDDESDLPAALRIRAAQQLKLVADAEADKPQTHP